MKPDRHLHVVCLDVPYPVDYGGACEMFHKVVALSRAGISITLHCYDYGRGRQPELDRWCRQVFYYPRNVGHKGFSLKLPYIVASRASDALTERLLGDEDPVLFEGIHTTYPLHSGRLAGRRCFVRLHNLEHEYYAMLSRHVPFGIRRFLYRMESALLRPFERALSGKAVFLSLTEGEAERLRSLAPGVDVRHLPAFAGRGRVDSQEGEGTFCLYHGNLSVPENDRAARWLLEEVFGGLELPFVVAGRRPSAALKRLAHRRNHTCIVEDPSVRELDDLMHRAQVHVLPSFSVTGVKYKLLQAVFSGRHVVADPRMLRGTGLEAACHLAEGAEAFRCQVASLFRRRFGIGELRVREALLESCFDDAAHADRLISWIWSRGR